MMRVLTSVLRTLNTKGSGKPLPLWQRVFLVLFLMVSCSFIGYGSGYYKGTGTMPFMPSQASTLPVEAISNVTSNQITEFIEADDTNLAEYGVGFNCVESALLLARSAHWEGIPAEVVRVDFAGGPGHLLLAFAAKNDGWLFVDPQTEAFVIPRVGGELAGKRITGLFILVGEWIPFIEVTE